MKITCPIKLPFDQSLRTHLKPSVKVIIYLAKHSQPVIS